MVDLQISGEAGGENASQDVPTYFLVKFMNCEQKWNSFTLVTIALTKIGRTHDKKHECVTFFTVPQFFIKYDRTDVLSKGLASVLHIRK